MRSTNLLALGLVALSLTAVACGSSASSDSSQPADTADGSDQEVKAAVIGEESNGKTVSVTAGRSFTVALEDNGASTGYSWVVKDDGGFGKAKESSIPGDVSRPGSPGTKKFTWSANAAGTHTITIEKVRPWAETTPPADTFKVTIDVVDASKVATCGGFAGLTCKSAGTFCNYGVACGEADKGGSCDAKPDFCPALVMQVCGCDGKTYNNGCEANRAGVSVAKSGACAK